MGCSAPQWIANDRPAVSDIAASATSIGAFFLDASDEFRRSTGRAGTIVRRVRIADCTIELHSTSAPLFDLILPPLEHRLDDATGAADTAIWIWEASASGSPPARVPWDSDSLGAGGLVNSSDEVMAVHETISDAVTLVHAGAGAGAGAILYRVGDHRALQWWERAAPLRPALCWALGGERRHLVHAGAVGDDRGGVVLVGGPGSGKTTAVLGALRAGLDLVADDYLVLDASGPARAFSLYNTVSVAAAPGVEPKQLRTLGRCPRESVPIRALVAPRIRGGHTRLFRIDRSDALRAWAPSTALHMPYDGGAVVASLARVIRQTPCFALDVGDDEIGVADAIVRALEGGGGR